MARPPPPDCLDLTLGSDGVAEAQPQAKRSRDAEDDDVEIVKESAGPRSSRRKAPRGTPAHAMPEGASRSFASNMDTCGTAGGADVEITSVVGKVGPVKDLRLVDRKIL